MFTPLAELVASGWWKALAWPIGVPRSLQYLAELKLANHHGLMPGVDLQRIATKRSALLRERAPAL